MIYKYIYRLNVKLNHKQNIEKYSLVIGIGRYFISIRVRRRPHKTKLYCFVF